MHFNWLMLIGALEGYFNLLTRTEVGGWGVKMSIWTRLVCIDVVGKPKWKNLFWIALFKPVWDENDKKKIIPCILDSFSMDLLIH